MKHRVSILAATLALTAFLGACSGGSNDAAKKSPAPNVTGPRVDVDDFVFKPKETTVKAGETLTWVFVGASQHDVTADDNSFKSETLDKGETFTHTFAAAGTFKYKCTIHPTMTGTVTVTA